MIALQLIAFVAIFLIVTIAFGCLIQALSERGWHITVTHIEPVCITCNSVMLVEKLECAVSYRGLFRRHSRSELQTYYVSKIGTLYTPGGTYFNNPRLNVWKAYQEYKKLQKLKRATYIERVDNSNVIEYIPRRRGQNDV